MNILNKLDSPEADDLFVIELDLKSFDTDSILSSNGKREREKKRVNLSIEKNNKY